MATDIFNDCVYDACIMEDPQKYSCEMLEYFATSCESFEGVDVTGWRSNTNCRKQPFFFHSTTVFYNFARNSAERKHVLSPSYDPAFG